jgi:sporulation protein YlmC with PRC-barrel domain
MRALRNIAGPTRIWRTLKGKDVKSNDGKDLGEIKDISENYIHVEKGIIHKDDSTLPVRKESAAIMVAASTSITPNKEMNIKSVDMMPMQKIMVLTELHIHTMSLLFLSNLQRIVGLRHIKKVFFNIFVSNGYVRGVIG